MKKLPANVNKKRWAMYAAGAAVAFSGTQTAEADIMHFVVADGEGEIGVLGELSFALGDSGDFLVLTNGEGYYATDPNIATGSILDADGAVAGGIAGFTAFIPEFGFAALYGENFASGAVLSTIPTADGPPLGFREQVGVPLVYGVPGPNTGFAVGESGFIGFRFDGGNEFGWARLTFNDSGVANTPGGNTFTIEEYAFSENGASITVGQTESVVVPEPTSLGLLALGAVGVLANRRRKTVA